MHELDRSGIEMQRWSGLPVSEGQGAGWGKDRGGGGGGGAAEAVCQDCFAN